VKLALVKQHLELYIAAHKEIHSMESAARELALNELKAHLESLNGNQRLMASERADFVRKDWFEVQHSELSKRITALELGDKENAGSRKPISDMIHWIATVSGSIFVLGVGWVLGHFIK
jgi:hypothetical protein